ncbi:MAG: hypothetical protein KAG66_20825, partial [Methylococcales bacterium]|nr:hypothetical protein [Methylococcales bacterium]
MPTSNLVTQITQANRQWQFVETVELCQTFLKRTPPESTSHAARLVALRESSLALWQLGQADTAWKQLTRYKQEAGEHSPHAVQALCQMAHILTRKGEFNQAQDKLDLAMQIARQLGYNLGLSSVYHQRGRL